MQALWEIPKNKFYYMQSSISASSSSSDSWLTVDFLATDSFYYLYSAHKIPFEICIPHMLELLDSEEGILDAFLKIPKANQS